MVEWIAFAFSVSGVVSLSVGPALPLRVLPTSLILGLASLAAGAAIGLSVGGEVALPSGIVSASILALCVVNAVRFRGRVSSLSALEPTFDTVSADGSQGTGEDGEEGCAPVLDKGAKQLSGKKSDEGWFSGIFGSFAVTNVTKDSATIHALAFGTINYGVWSVETFVEGQSIYKIDCVGSKCTIDGTLPGNPTLKDGRGSAETVVVPRQIGDTILIAKIETAAFLDATGGPKLTVSLKVVGVEVEWPAASRAIYHSFDPIIWRCVAVEDDLEISVG